MCAHYILLYFALQEFKKKKTHTKFLLYTQWESIQFHFDDSAIQFFFVAIVHRMLAVLRAIHTYMYVCYFFLLVSFSWHFYIFWLLYPWFFCSVLREFIFVNSFFFLFYIIAFYLAKIFFCFPVTSIESTPSPTLHLSLSSEYPSSFGLLLVDSWFRIRLFFFIIPISLCFYSLIQRATVLLSDT